MVTVEAALSAVGGGITLKRYDVSEQLPWPKRGDTLFACGDEDRDDSALLVHSEWWLYSSGYRLAAEILTQYVSHNPKNRDILVYPIVFLYRHYLELRLKEIIRAGGAILAETDEAIGPHMHHDVWELWTVCLRILANVCPDETEDLDVVGQCLKELQTIDPKSTAFRYPVDKSGLPVIPPSVAHVSIGNLFRVMERIRTFLDACESAISAMVNKGENAADHF